MDINLTVLEQYLKKYDNPVTLTLSVDGDFLGLIGIKQGENQYSNRIEYLEPSDFKEILAINGVFEKIKAEEESFEEKRLAGRASEVDKNIDEYIYGTLAKYIIQILNAAIAKIFYPEIVPLEKHRQSHFRNSTNV